MYFVASKKYSDCNSKRGSAILQRCHRTTLDSNRLGREFRSKSARGDECWTIRIISHSGGHTTWDDLFLASNLNSATLGAFPIMTSRWSKQSLKARTNLEFLTERVYLIWQVIQHSGMLCHQSNSFSQGSSLGPFIFLTCINDLCLTSNLFQHILFASDSKNDNDTACNSLWGLFNNINGEMDLLFNWFCTIFVS